MEKSFIILIKQALLMPETELALNTYKSILGIYSSPTEEEVDKLERYLSHYILLKILKESPLNIISNDVASDAKNILNIILTTEELDELKCDLTL